MRTQTMLSFCRSVAVGSLITAAMNGPAHAQQAPIAASPTGAQGIEDIVVTAQRRETRLQDTPVAVTAFSADALAERNLSNTSELANFAPNLSVTPSAGNSSSPATPSVYIRGIGQNDFIINSDPGVGLYVDGVYVARSTGSIFDLLDVERVEVLRGPQGTLFGKNAVGGALNITTRAPSDILTGRIEGTVGNYDRYELRGYLSGPLAPGVAAKVALGYKEREGYGDRLDPATDEVVGHWGGQENLVGRAGLRAELSSALTLDLSGDFARNRDQALPSDYQYVTTGQPVLTLFNGLIGLPTGAALSPVWETPGDFDNYGTGGNQSDQDIYGVSGTLTWVPGAVTLKSITGYRSIDSVIQRDGDGSPADYLGSIYELDQWQFSQELQAYGLAFDDRLDWLVGLYYLHEKAREDTFGFAANGLYAALEALPGQLGPIGPTIPCAPPFVAPGCAGNPINVGLDIAIDYRYRQVTDSYAAFAQGSYRLVDGLSLTLGLRYTKEDKDLVAEQIRRRNSGVDIVPPGTERAVSYSAWTPRIGLEYKPADDVLLYAYAARGFKAGGINGRVFDITAFRDFAPEKVWTYEGGFKTDLFDRRLRLNGAIFYNDYTDIQVTVQDTSTGSISNYTANAAAGRSYGFELEASARPAPGLDLGATIAYLDTKYTESAARDIREGAPFQKVPEWTLNLFAQYEAELGGGYTLTPRVDLAYRSDYFNDPILSENIAEDGYTLLNARLTLAADAGWSLAAFGTNLTDERYIVAGLNALPNGLGTVERLYGRPREYGLSMSIRF